MQKKLILIIVSVVVVVALATAFVLLAVNRGKEASEEDEFLPTAGQVDASKLKDTKLTFYFEARSNDVMTEVLQAVNEKLRSELKTEVAFEMVWDYPENYYAKLKEAVAAGSPCDAFFYATYFPASLPQLAKEGLAADLTEDFPRYAPDYYSQFSGEELNVIKSNGKIYAIPYRIPTAVRKCVLVRDDLMEKYSIPAIKSYDGYEVYLDTIKKKEPGLIPMNYWDTTIGLFSEVSGYVVVDYEMGLVYKWNDPNMKLTAWEQTPGFSEGLNRIKSWYDKEYLMKNLGISQIDENIITSGKWVSFISDFGQEFDFNAILAAKGITDYKYVAYPLYDGFSPRNSPLESAMVINAKSKQADRVLMFINWLQSKQENYDLFMYGVKGKHYNDMGDYIVPVEAESSQDNFFQWGWRAPFRNIAYERANFPGLKEAVAAYSKVIQEKTKYPPHMGFVPDYSSLADIVQFRRMSYSELDQKVYTGTFQPSDVDEFIKEQKDNGVQKLIDTIQGQLDSFKQSK